MVESTAFSSILPFLQTQSYWVIFILMIIEGPIITYVAAFAAALGIFNVYFIFILSILGNSVPDKLIYLVGRFSRGQTIERLAGYFGLSKQRIKTLEGHLKKHLGKTIIFAKLAPALPIPGMLLAGFMRSDLKKFLIISTLFDIIVSILFTATGYYSGLAADTTLKYFKLEAIILPLLILVTILAYYLIKWIYTEVLNYFK